MNKKLTITLPSEMIRQIDNLVKYNLSNRSSVIRQAVWQYVRDPQYEIIANPDAVAVSKMYDYIKDDHPYLDPSDADLIKFLYDYKSHEL
jgi:metal-responsive CopG/Arc/MetJ family transcriptional regulator